MKQKREVSLILLTIILLALSVYFVNSATTVSNQLITSNLDKSIVNDSYICFMNSLPNYCEGMDTETTSWTLLSLGFNQTFQDACYKQLSDLRDEDNGCWPVGGCTVKDTSLALFTLKMLSTKTTSLKSEVTPKINSAVTWLSKTTMGSSSLSWYLQVDDSALAEDEQMSCRVYSLDIDTSTTTLSPTEVIFNYDKTVDSLIDGSGCFSETSTGDYFLKINSGCENKKFDISCNVSYAVSFLYKDSDSHWNIIGTSTSTNANVPVITEIPYSCFSSDGTTCDYEGSLFAYSALTAQPSDPTSLRLISSTLPYLKSERENYPQFLPSAFLLSSHKDSKSSNPFYTDLSGRASTAGYNQKYWGSFYDTGIALFGLGTLADYEKDSTYGNPNLFNQTLTYLLEQRNSDDKCFLSDTRDTALILYAGFPVTPTSQTSIGWNCFESDDGKSYSNYSSATAYYFDGISNDSDTIVQKSDTCYNSTNLIEYFCSSKTAKELSNETIFCEYGCSKGRCRTSEDDKCEHTCNISEDIGPRCQTSSLLSYCTDENNDGCYEWGNSTRCASGCYQGKCQNTTTSTPSTSCTSAGYYCISSSSCSSENVLTSYTGCPFYSNKVCCKTPGTTIPVSDETCAEKGGKQCLTSQTCSGTITTAEDTLKCCLGTCTTSTTDDEETECEQNGYTCKSKCDSGEETAIYDCDFSDVCCSSKQGSSYSTILIILLILLIILIVLAIIYRDQLKVFLFKKKSGVSSSGVSTMRRPPMPPQTPFARPQMPRQMVPRQNAPQQARPALQQKSGDSDFDETMKRLKNMSK